MKNLKHFTILLVAAIAALAFTSCGEEDYPYSPLRGNWQLVSVNSYPVPEPEVIEYCFFGNGQGTYGQYSSPGIWSEYPITWSTEVTPGGAEYLYIRFYDGRQVEYLVRLYAMTLELTDLYTGDNLVFEEY